MPMPFVKEYSDNLVLLFEGDSTNSVLKQLMHVNDNLDIHKEKAGRNFKFCFEKLILKTLKTF